MGWFEWREKNRIKLKILIGDIHFPGETDKISRHSGILIPPGTRIQNFKESKKWKNWIYIQRITPSKKNHYIEKLVRLLFYESLDYENQQLREAQEYGSDSRYSEVRSIKEIIPHFLVKSLYN